MTKPHRKATKAELRAEIAKLRSVGGRLSNVAFNLSQRRDGVGDYEDLLHRLYKEWDAIERAEKGQ